MIANLIAAAVLSLGCSAIGRLRKKPPQPKRIVTQKEVDVAKGILNGSAFRSWMADVEVRKEEQ